MPRRKQSKAKCTYCGQEFVKSRMTKHLSSCSQRQEAIAKAERKHARDEKLYYLRVQDAWASSFWLDLEVKGSATLQDIDSYLRAIWLECCGHMSQFSIGGWEGNEIDTKRRIHEVFEPGAELTHIYDFGTSSETLIKAIEIREGKPTTRHPIVLMARNEMPEMKCEECDELATWLCHECIYDEEKAGTLCERHAKTHPHENYGEPLPIVNSPRVGMCGYEGPAEPPY
ncbi:MAG: IS1096 element passenger TnpR family protein [Candidatus Binatia bacterium]